MTNPRKRGSAPDRAQPAYLRPGTFEEGHKKQGGRKRGTPNAFPSDYKKAILEAAYASDRTAPARTASLDISCGSANGT